MATGIQISPPSDITVGTTAISNGTEGRVLFQGTGNVVQQSDGLTFNSGTFTVKTGASTRFTVGNDALYKTFNLCDSILSNGFVTRLAPPSGTPVQIELSGNGLNLSSNFLISSNASEHYVSTSSVIRTFINNNGMVIGNSTSPGARLDVRAQGALSTDLALRVRNSADNLDIIRATGAGDVFIGIGAGNSSTGANVTALGVNSLRSNTSGSHNTSFGHTALFSITTSAANTAMGSLALINLTSGDNNIAFGFNSGRYISSGANLTISNSSLFIGNGTRPDADNQTNQIVIGNAAIGAGSNTATLGNTSIVKTILRGTINAAGLPTSPVGLVTGDIWNNLGILTIV
jgi:hypothetical protein